MQKTPGRPMKYKDLLNALPDDEIFTPAKIAHYAVEHGFITTTESEQKRLEKQRIRITLGRLSNNHNFPDEGDGMVTLKGQAPTPGWFGWRWKSAIRK